VNPNIAKTLKKMGACQEAVDWCKPYGTDWDRAWKESVRGDHMLWLAGKLSGRPESLSRKKLVLAACGCARLALPYVRNGELRPLKSVEVAEQWARGENGITIQDVRDASHAASAASAAEAADHAASAASAASAAASAASAAWYAAQYAEYAAAEAAQYAAYAASAAARQATLKVCANIVRRYYPIAPAYAAQYAEYAAEYAAANITEIIHSVVKKEV